MFHPMYAKIAMLSSLAEIAVNHPACKVNKQDSANDTAQNLPQNPDMEDEA
mgnify:CR=1 FL=1